MVVVPSSTPLEDVLGRRLLLVTGKGGVGRTTVAAALAHLAAGAGRRVLVAELVEDGGVDSTLARLFGRERLPAQPVEVAPNIHGGVLLSRVGQELFLSSMLHVATLARAALNSEPLRRLLQAGPALRELGIFFHLLHHLKATRPDGSRAYDTVVLDMPATGHTLALTGLPEILLQMVSRGPIRTVVSDVQAQLRDPAGCGVYVVTIPEVLAVTETQELLEQLRTDGMPVAAVVVNRVPAVSLDADERASLPGLLEQRHLWGVRSLMQQQEAHRAVALLRDSTSAPVLTLAERAEHGAVQVRGMAEEMRQAWQPVPAQASPATEAAP